MKHTMIDIHHHFIGKHRPAGAVMPEWSLEIDEKDMDEMGISGALLSLPVGAGKEQTHAINTMIKQLAEKNSERYVPLACLPLMDDIGSILEEINFANNEMNAAGFSIPANAGGIYIGDDKMDPVLEKLNECSAVILLHPTKPSKVDENLFVKDMSVYEFPFDTTRAVMDLVYRGKVKKYPNIKWIISHAGGTIPFLSYRLSTVASENKVTQLTEGEILECLRSMYYDIALSTSDIAMSALKEFVGSSHILFGTDYPLRRKDGVHKSVLEFKNSAVFNEKEKQDIMFKNALRLFPVLNK